MTLPHFSLTTPFAITSRQEAELALDQAQQFRAQLVDIEAQSAVFLLEPLFTEYPELLSFHFGLHEEGRELPYVISTNLWEPLSPTFYDDFWQPGVDLSESEQDQHDLCISLYQELELWISSLSEETRSYLSHCTFVRPDPDSDTAILSALMSQVLKPERFSQWEAYQLIGLTRTSSSLAAETMTSLPDVGLTRTRRGSDSL